MSSAMSIAAVQSVVLATAEEGGHEVSQAVSWGVGATTFAILAGVLIALIAFGAGREHG